MRLRRYIVRVVRGDGAARTFAVAARGERHARRLAVRRLRGSEAIAGIEPEKARKS